MAGAVVNLTEHQRIAGDLRIKIFGARRVLDAAQTRYDALRAQLDALDDVTLELPVDNKRESR
jgi:hypothetical protein